MELNINVPILPISYFLMLYHHLFPIFFWVQIAESSDTVPEGLMVPRKDVLLDIIPSTTHHEMPEFSDPNSVSQKLLLPNPATKGYKSYSKQLLPRSSSKLMKTPASDVNTERENKQLLPSGSFFQTHVLRPLSTRRTSSLPLSHMLLDSTSPRSDSAGSVRGGLPPEFSPQSSVRPIHSSIPIHHFVQSPVLNLFSKSQYFHHVLIL